MAILTTVVSAAAQVRNAIKEVYPEATVVYDQNLSYDTGETYSRITTSSTDFDNLSNTGLPLILHNRSVIRRSQVGGRPPMRTYEEDELKTKLELNKFSLAHCEFDFRFLYLDKDIASIESFEIDYVSENGIGDIKRVDLDLSAIDLGVWPYYITWNQPLDDLTMNINGSTYIGVGGSATVMGWFLTMTGTAKVIQTINTKIFDRSQNLLDEFNIPRES